MAVKKKLIEKPAALYDTFERKSGPAKKSTHYCPGCGHGNVHKYIGEVLEELEVTERTVFVSPVGCAVFGYYYFDTGNTQAPHGRAPAVATGVKRVNPEAIVISYQGDGDLAAIGTAETLHAASRGENITVIFINNAIYGMTGGQMAPTTLLNQITATTPNGRAEAEHGNPIRMAEIIATLPAVTYVERVMIGGPKDLMKTRKAIKKALTNQVEGRGYSFVEILSSCPSGWKMTPCEGRDWVREEMTKVFPLGVLKDESKLREPGTWHRKCLPFDPARVNEYLHKQGTADDAHEVLPLKKPLGIKFAGFGGQGVLFMGLFVSKLGIRAGHTVSWIPSYGPEMRGGTANCSVNLSTEVIGSPLVDHPDVLIAMNQPSVDKFEAEIVDGGVMIVDTTMVDHWPDNDKIHTLALPASKIATEVGNKRVANMVVVGALMAMTGAYTFDFTNDNIGSITGKFKMEALNQEAFKRGWDYAKAHW